jgi:DNA-binding transcriptional ArsR family regulator
LHTVGLHQIPGLIIYNQMVVGITDEAVSDRVFHALADATRRDIVWRTMQAEHSVSGLARFYPMSFAAVQKHVSVLHTAGLVTKRRQGREQIIAADGRAVQQARRLLDHLEALWLDRIDRIGAVLTDDKGEQS